MYSPSQYTLVDRNTTLCLACSGSLPPKNDDIHMTNCCQRPICPTCIANNSRLARYDPCLACLGGVDAVVSRSQSKNPFLNSLEVRNVDGAVRDEETFVLGDDDDASDEEIDEAIASSPPPPYPSAGVDLLESTNLQDTEDSTRSNVEKATPSKYYVARNDTLRGIALRFGVEGRELCRLNNLPPSALSTTPHLVHTRAFIVLPSSAKMDD